MSFLEVAVIYSLVSDVAFRWVPEWSMLTVSSGGQVEGEFLQSTIGRGSGRPIGSECQLRDLQHVERIEKTTRIQAACRCDCLASVSCIKPQEVSWNLLKIILKISPLVIQSLYLLDSRVTVFTTFRTSSAAKYVISLFVVYRFVFIGSCCLFFLFTVYSYYSKLSCSSW